MKRKPQYYLYRIYLEFKHPIEQVISKLLFMFWGAKLGKEIQFLGLPGIRNLNRIEIGDSTRIISGARNLVGTDVRTYFETGQNGYIRIGSRVGMSNCVLISQESITIEDQVYIGGGTRIYDNDFHSINFNDRINRPGLIPTAPIVIKAGSFIGGHSIILKGVVIGRQSVVGAGSVVTKSIPDFEIWAGVPAKKIGLIKQ
jgi:acetyltransferase-like isoleucine patch superfamily enzyme